MTNLSLYVSELLYDHECIIIPGLGGFITRKRNAVIYAAQNLFTPPAKRLFFNAQLTHNDGILAQHISQKNNIDYESSLREINAMVDQILYDLYKGNTVTFDEIGTLSRLNNGLLKFDPVQNTNIQDENYGLNSFMMPPLQSYPQKKHLIKDENLDIKPKKSLVVKSSQIAAVILFVMLSVATYFFQLYNIKDQIQSAFYPHLFSITDLFTEDKKENSSVEITQPEPIAPTETIDENTSAEKTLNEIEATNLEAEPVVETATSATNLAAETAAPISKRYYIIIGAFQEQQRAEKLCAQFKENGNPNAKILDIPSSRLYRVSMQEFDNKEEAQLSLKNIQESMQADAWLFKQP